MQLLVLLLLLVEGSSPACLAVAQCASFADKAALEEELALALQPAPPAGGARGDRLAHGGRLLEETA